MRDKDEENKRERGGKEPSPYPFWSDIGFEVVEIGFLREREREAGFKLSQI